MDRVALLSAPEAHLALVHLSMVLLLVVPVLLIGAGVNSLQRRRRLISAFIVLSLGTTLMFAAHATGDIASAEHQLTAEIHAAVFEHRALATEAAATFAATSVLLGLILLLTLRFRLRLSDLDAVLPVGFVILYSIGVLLLLTTFYRGGELVHELGI